MRVEWDPEKDEINQRKLGISFREAAEVFHDPLHIAILDRRFSYFEERWIVLGRTHVQQTLVVAALWYFDEKGEEIIRIISAREATAHERRQYEEL
ncbi:MAG: BrnT family toxin [Spirochaetota bacterium]